jgi:hypothetical protein
VSFMRAGTQIRDSPKGVALLDVKFRLLLYMTAIILSQDRLSCKSFMGPPSKKWANERHPTSILCPSKGIDTEPET